MIRDAGLALVIVMGFLTLIATIENNDEIARANERREVLAERDAQADSALGIKRIELVAK